MNADQPTTAPAGAEVNRYGLFEVTFRSAAKFDNPFWDPKVSAEFVGPDGAKVAVDGYYHGGGQWRVRFSPRTEGPWTYSARMTGPGGVDLKQSGEFRCVPGSLHGSLRISRQNPYRLEHADGTPFYPIGIQTCGYFQIGFDGPGPEAGRGWRTVSAAEWCKAFEGAVNLVRWQLGTGTKAGCALPLIAEDGPADHYDTDLAAKMDDLLALQKASGFAHIFILFQDMSLWGNGKTVFGSGRDLTGYKSLRAENLPLQEKYLRYVVARWAAQVDIWELFNEDSYAGDDYLAHLAKVVRQADPYDRLLTTNYARPRAKWCELVTWHEYMGMPAAGVDAYLAKEIGKFKSYGKPVVNTEFGNQGWLSNYDPVKWRIAVWSAYMNESSLLFWGMSGRQTVGRRPYRGNANAYIGRETRQYLRVLNGLTKDLPVDMRPVASGYTEHNDVRLYALSNGKVSLLYVHHFSDHEKAYRIPDPVYVQTGPGEFKLTWIDPADGKEVHTERLATEQQYLVIKAAPPVTIDLACRIDRLD